MQNQPWLETPELFVHIGWFLFFLLCLVFAFLTILLICIHRKWIRDHRVLSVRIPNTPSILVRSHEPLLIGGKGCPLELGNAPDGIAFATLRWHGGNRSQLEIVPISGSLHIDHSPRIRTYGDYQLGQLLKVRYDHQTYETRILDASWEEREAAK